MTLDRRKYNREWARKTRHSEQTARNIGHRFCQFRSGRFGSCGAVLEHQTTHDGTVVATCPKCERRRRGVCQDCPRPVAGRRGSALRCDPCRQRERTAAVRRHRVRDPERHLRAVRRWQRTHQDHVLAYKRAWRQTRPELVREQKTRSHVRHPKANAERAKQWRQRTGYRGQTDGHRCVTCELWLRGRTKKCLLCKRRDEDAAQRWLETA